MKSMIILEFTYSFENYRAVLDVIDTLPSDCRQEFNLTLFTAGERPGSPVAIVVTSDNPDFRLHVSDFSDIE